MRRARLSGFPELWCLKNGVLSREWLCPPFFVTVFGLVFGALGFLDLFPTPVSDFDG